MYKSFDEIKIRPKYFPNQTQSIQYRVHGAHTERITHTCKQFAHTHTHTEIHRPGKLYSSFLRYAACVPGHPFSLFPPLKYIFIFCCINFIFGMFRGFPVCPQAYFMYNFNTVSIHMCPCVCYRTAFMYACVCVWVGAAWLLNIQRPLISTKAK